MCNIQSDFRIPSKVIFQNLNFTLPKAQVSALIGRNGQGKSLLMQLLHQTQHSSPHCSGQVSWQMHHAYLPQLHRLKAATIAEALEVSKLHRALKMLNMVQPVSRIMSYLRIVGICRMNGSNC